MTPELVGVISIFTLGVFLALRVPVGIAMIVVSTAGYGYIISPGGALSKLGSSPYIFASSYSLSVIPLFVLMGMFLSSAGLGSEIFKFANAVLGKLRGGMAMATIGASMLFSAVSGSAVATATTISIVAVPEMRKYKYNDSLSTGSAAVGGTLGILIPPSGVLVLYGVLTEEPIGRILIAGILPGIMTGLLLIITTYLVVRWKPQLAPIAEYESRTMIEVLLISKTIWPIPVIFCISMGGIYGGVFTPTEAGAVGAFLSLAYTLLARRLGWGAFLESVSSAVRIVAMLFIIIIGGKMFGGLVAVSRIPLSISQSLLNLDVAPFVVILLIFIVYFLMGIFMEEWATLVIMTPIIYPIIIDLGYNGIWFGVLTIMMLLTGLLTPPVGVIGFVVASVTKVSSETVFRGLIPFWITLLIAGLLIIIFPEIALFLPNLM